MGCFCYRVSHSVLRNGVVKNVDVLENSRDRETDSTNESVVNWTASADDTHSIFYVWKEPNDGLPKCGRDRVLSISYICMYRTRNYSPFFSVSQSAHTAERYSRERANALVGSIAQGPIHKWWLYLAFTHVITQRERWIPNYYYCYSSSFSLLFTFIDESIFPYAFKCGIYYNSSALDIGRSPLLYCGLLSDWPHFFQGYIYIHYMMWHDFLYLFSLYMAGLDA